MEGNTSYGDAAAVKAAVFYVPPKPALGETVVNCVVAGRHLGVKGMLMRVAQSADACVVLMLACELAFQDKFRKIPDVTYRG